MRLHLVVKMVSVSDVLGSIGSLEIDSLAHYASEYYDPAKAKAYYERTKKLKGREKPLTETQRSATTFAKSNIATARKDATEKNRDSQKARLEGLRAKADEAVKAIQGKLDGASKDFDQKVADIANAIKTVPLNEISPTADPKVKAFLEKQNKHIRDANVAKGKKQVRELADIVAKVKKEAAEERRRVADDLRTSLQKARDDYAAQVVRTKAKYDKAVDTETKNIRTQVK